MKKITYIILILLAGILSILCFSCQDDESNNIFPDKYIKILSLKESGILDLEMNTTQQSVMDSILILKGGGRPNTVSNMELKVLTKEEAAIFGGYEIDRIQIIPTDAYEMVSGEKIILEANESYKYVPITFYPQKIYTAMKDYGDDVVWSLPIVLVSSTDTINTSQNKLFIRFDVRSPLLDWNMDEVQNIEITYRSLEWTISAKIANTEENTLDFTCELDVSENEQLVTAYNAKYGTTYELLPETAYDFDKFSFNIGEKVSTANITLTRTGLQSNHEYLLPLKLGTLSTNAMDITDDIRYLVVSSPKYGYEDVDRSDWKVLLSNCQEGWQAPRFHATSLFDGDTNTTWATNWSKAIATSDDYDYSSIDTWGYHTFLLRRDIPNVIIVIDLGREIALGGVGIAQGSLDIGDRDLKSSEFYLADSFTFTADGDLDNYNNVNKGNNWNLAITCNDVPNVGGGPYWYYLSDSDLSSGIPKGRFLKIRPTESHRGNHLVSFSELFMKELVSIDGYPVE